MIKEMISQVYSYNAWANNRILETATRLTEEQYRANTNPSFGSVHNTLVHIMSAQWVWLSRWVGSYPRKHLDPTGFAGLDEVRTRWAEVESNTHLYITRCSEENLIGPLTYINSQNAKKSYPLWQLMLHQVNHATQHRSEIALILTAFNQSPGGIDFIVYIDSETSKKKKG
jgi:uncharacterized damage-inducible protein DinB